MPSLDNLAGKTVFCNSCSGPTQHVVKTSFEVKDYEGDMCEASLDSVTNYQVIQCAGCETVSFRQVSNFFVEGGSFYTYYPSRLKDWLTEKTVVGLPPHIRRVYREILDAYNAELVVLCASGLRTLVEGLCNHFQIVEKDGTGKPVALGIRIRELSMRRLIPSSLADALRAHKELGNDAVHNLVAPSKEELKLAIGLIETAFENLFNVATRHHELGDKMTRRIIGE